MKSLAAQQLKVIPLWMKYLHAGHIGRHQTDRCVHDARIQGIEIVFLNQRSADVVQLQPVVRRPVIRRCFSCRMFVKLTLPGGVPVGIFIALELEHGTRLVTDPVIRHPSCAHLPAALCASYP